MSDTELNLPSAFEKTEIDSAVDDFISSAAKEFAEEPAVEPDPGVSEAAGEPGGDAGAPGGTVEPAESEDAAVSRGLERLVAREVELRTREDRLKSTESEVEALRARVRELEPLALSPELLNQIKLSPTSALRTLGLDPDEVVRTALMEKIGDKATPEMKEMLERTQTKRELAQIKAEIAAAERQRAAQAYFDRVAQGAQDFVRNQEGISKHPTVFHVAKNDPGRVFTEIMQEISEDAAKRAKTEPHADPISYEEAAKRVETRWSALRAMLGVQVVPLGNPSNASMPQANKEAEPKKSPPANSIKPPDRPLAPWLQAPKEAEDAIRAAIDEYKRAESKK